jgi:hypothetical protein
MNLHVYKNTDSRHLPRLGFTQNTAKILYDKENHSITKVSIQLYNLFIPRSPTSFIDCVHK